MSAAADASLAAAVFAVDPLGLGGVCLRSLAQPARTQWLQLLRELLPAAIPLRRIPFNITDGRLLGGLDLAATLRANRPVAERGVLAAADGGVVVVSMAERLSAHTTACLTAVLDAGAIALAREGVQIRDRARVGIVALDESMLEDERVRESLLDRLALLVDLSGFDLRTPLVPAFDSEDIRAAQRRLPTVVIAPDLIAALCATALALGAGSVRVSLRAVCAAKVLAALDGRDEVSEDDAAAAGRLVLAPRATTLPRAESPPTEDAQDPPSTPPAPQAPTPPADARATAAPVPPVGEPAAEPDAAPPPDARMSDRVLEATQAAIPRGLLEQLKMGAAQRAGSGGVAGRAGALRKGGSRGRPADLRSGPPRGHSRLNLIETLRAAAPWQRLRGRLDGTQGVPAADARMRIQPGDFRVTQYQQRAQTLTIFVVDASGSSALNRLAEAKGAVELLLADCYVRRDQVAVVAFRGRTAELLLPPTRSLVRAKRNLAGLPGGGGTPLAAALDSARVIAQLAQRRGETPFIVVLTDGRANVARSGAGGREAAHAEALQAARLLYALRIAALFVDTSSRPNPLAEQLAVAMDAQYVPLPYANARSLSRVVTAAAQRAGR